MTTRRPNPMRDADGRWTAADVPDLSGRTAVVTGGAAGIGLETARALAGKGATVILACRDPSKAGRAADRLRAVAGPGRVRVVRLDLASLASVREAASEIRSGWPRLDLLINNAGVMAVPYQRRPSRCRSHRALADEHAAGAGADQPPAAHAQLLDRAKRADGGAADAAGRGRPGRQGRRVLRPGPAVRHRLAGPGGVERSLPRRGGAAPAVGGLRTADRGLVPDPWPCPALMASYRIPGRALP
jgi:hypothetical protein